MFFTKNFVAEGAPREDARESALSRAVAGTPARGQPTGSLIYRQQHCYLN
jgi:hypothetical protein